jgi:hypothetical protein
MKKLFPFIIVFIFFSGCSEKITTQSFIPEDAAGIINFDIQKIINSDFFLDLNGAITEKLNTDPLEIINLTLQLSFDTGIDNLLYSSIFIKDKPDITGGIIFEFEEIDTESAFETFDKMPEFQRLYYKDYTYYYSDIFNSCISANSNFIFYSYGTEIMEDILDTIEKKQNSINNDLKETLNRVNNYPVYGAYQFKNSSFSKLNEYLNSDLDNPLKYENILGENIVADISTDFSESFDLEINLNFINISDSETYSIFLSGILDAIKEKLISQNSSGIYNLHLDFLNNLSISTKDFSITINTNIHYKSFLDFLTGIL